MAQPLNPFAEKPVGLDAMRLPMPVISQASDFAPAPTLSAPVGAPSPAQGVGQTAFSYLAPIASGMASGSQTQATTSAPSATMQTVGAGVQGAVAGAALGSVLPGVGTAVGAGVGGLVGLVSGGIQSYFGLREARAQRRDYDRKVAEIEKKEAERFAYEKELNAQTRADNLQARAENRADSKEGLRYNRRQAALSSQFNAFNSVLALLNNNMAQDQSMKNLFIQQGR